MDHAGGIDKRGFRGSGSALCAASVSSEGKQRLRQIKERGDGGNDVTPLLFGMLPARCQRNFVLKIAFNAETQGFAELWRQA